MASTSKHSEIKSLYLLKGICAFFVVCCHAPWAGIFNDYIAPLRMAAVPFFFTISGYFLYQENYRRMKASLRNTLKKLVPIIIICNIFYLLWNYPNHGFIIRSWEQVWRLFFLGDSVIGHLWYLSALAWACIFYCMVLYLLEYCKLTQIKTKKYLIYLIYIMLPLYLLAVMALSYSPWTYSMWGFNYSVFGCFPYALPYLSLGFYIKQHQSELLQQKWGRKALILLILLFVEFTFCNYIRNSLSDGVLICSMPFVFTIFMYCLQNPNPKIGNQIILIGRKYAGNIYYWHMAVITLCIKLASLLGISRSDFEWVIAPVSFGLSYIASWLIVEFQQKIKINILR